MEGTHSLIAPESTQSRLGGHFATLPMSLIQLFLVTPKPTGLVRVIKGSPFPVTVRLETEGTQQCEVFLAYDSEFFEEVSGKSNPLITSEKSAMIDWLLDPHRETEGSVTIGVEGRANGLRQQALFQIKVEQS